MLPNPDKRQQHQLVKKAERIGELLGMEMVPSHLMAWKEPRLQLETNECYPLIDVLLAIAEKLAEKPKKRPGPKPKKQSENVST